MNLLDMLQGSLTSEESLQALSEKAGTDGETTRGLIDAALPMLLGALTNNASSQEGAQSLLGALQQHTDTSSMAAQLTNADANDGGAIINHILGGNTGNVVQQLSGQTGASNTQVTNLLSNMAPALMSGLSAATTTAQASNADDGFDFTDLLGAFGGASQQSSGGLLSSLLGGGSSSGGGLLSGLLGGLFGGSSSQSEDTSAFDGSSLLTSLLSLLK